MDNIVDNIVIDRLGGLCPVQAEGTIDGVPFYFRSRGEHWSIEIGEGNTAKVVEALTGGGEATREDVEARPVWRYEEPYGQWPEAGYLDAEQARAFIQKGAEIWRRVEGL